MAVDPALSNYPRFLDRTGFETFETRRSFLTVRNYIFGFFAALEGAAVWYAAAIFLQCQNQQRLLSTYAHDYRDRFEENTLRSLTLLVIVFTFLIAWRRARMARVAVMEWDFPYFEYVKRRESTWAWIVVACLAFLCFGLPLNSAPDLPLGYISFCVLSYVAFGTLYRYVGYRRQVALLTETDRGTSYQEALTHLEDIGAEAPKKLYWESVGAFLGSLTIVGAPLFSEWHQRKVIDAYIQNRDSLVR